MGSPTTISMLSLGADIALMGSILLFVHRVLRNRTNPRGLRQLGELEGTIRSLIREAEGAGKSLNDQLIRRQESLEKLLFDLESCEKRIHRVQSRAEETRGGVDVAMAKVQKALDALNAALNRYQTREHQLRNLEESNALPSRASDASQKVNTIPASDEQSQSSEGKRDGSNLSRHWFEEPEGVARAIKTVSAHRSSVRANSEGNESAFQEQIARKPSVASKEKSISSLSEEVGRTSENQPERRALERVSASSLLDQISIDRTETPAPSGFRESLPLEDGRNEQQSAGGNLVKRSVLPADQVRLLLAAAHKRREVQSSADGRSVLRSSIDPRLGVLGGLRRSR
jgi:hypothetical protein